MMAIRLKNRRRNVHVIEAQARSRLSFVDLTGHLEEAISGAGLRDGFVIAFCVHTTCGLLINEWENGALSDLARRLESLAPTDHYYAHDDLTIRTQNLVPDERANGHSHVTQMLLGGTSQVIPVADGRPCFGRWQRLFLIELDEPKPRTVRFHALRDPGPA